MKTGLIRWLRLVAPPDWSIALLLIGCGAFEGLHLWLSWMAGWQQVVGTEFFAGRDLLCVLAAFVLGYYRILAFHPQYDPDYLNWLWMSPWRANKPLPKGPLHLTLQDVLLVLAIVGLMYHNAHLSLLLVPLAFLLGYVLALMMSLWAVDLPWLGYLLSFLAGLIILTAHRSLIVGISVAAVVYLVAWLCVRWTLATFPWSARATEWRKRAAKNRQAVLTGQRVSVLQSVDLANPEGEAPWPYNRLHARPLPPSPSRADRLAIVVLACWWALVLFSLPKNREVALSLGSTMYIGLLSACIVGRLMVYVVPCRPPISFWGRLRTFRWIIPGYDHVFLAPAATLVMGIAAPIVLHRLGLPPIAVLSLSLFPFLVTTLLGGPRLSRWLLTSNSRLSPGIKNQQMFEEI